MSRYPASAAEVSLEETAADTLDSAGEILRNPSLSIIGLGYVGAVSAACFAKLGLPVLGVDVDAEKVAAVASGQSPIVEPGLSAMLAEGAVEGRIQATDDLEAAVHQTNVTLIMVGTPSRQDGTCELGYVEEVSLAIGRALAKKAGHHVVVLRCSVPPGTTLGVVVPLIEKGSGKRLGEDFSVAFCPEFLREGAAIKDFFACSRTVIGASDDIATAVVRRIFNGVETKFVSASIPVAETVKYVDNVWHATKVVFANEVGRVCKQLDLDSHDVMNIFVMDNKLNISPAYMKPGFAFGGSCLPKDVRAFARMAADRGVDIPLISHVMASNRAQIEQVHQLLAPYRGRRIAFLGVAFKSGTDDIRESPIFEVIARLLTEGENISIHDSCWPSSSISGSCTPVPHVRQQDQPAGTSVVERIAALASSDLADVISRSDVLVVSHNTDAYRKAITERPAHVDVIDLVRLFAEPPIGTGYQGISW